MFPLNMGFPVNFPLNQSIEFGELTLLDPRKATAMLAPKRLPKRGPVT